MRRAHPFLAGCLRLVRMCLVLGLALNPLAHALNLSAAAAPTAGSAVDAAMPCHHADPAGGDGVDSPPPGYADCCCQPGSACHCAAPVAPPSLVAGAAVAPPHDYSPVVTALQPGPLPAPEPPPPRA